MTTKRHQNPFSNLRPAVIACLMGLALCASLFGLAAHFDNGLGFNSKVWIANPSPNEGKNTIRRRMVDDLMRHHLRKGMSRQQVRQWLGKPDNFAYDKQIGRDVYDLGYLDGSFEIDPSSLFLQYDANGKLIAIDVNET